MSRFAIISLCTILVVAAIANSYAINVHGRDREMYPMTAWQMFSGRPKTVARQFVFDVVTQPGNDPIEIHSRFMFSINVKFAPGNTRRIMTGIMKSVQYGCSGYTLRDYADCKKNPIRPWVIPKDIAETWVRCAMQELNLSQPPYSLTPILIEYPLNNRFQEMLDSGKREAIFTWLPGSGDYVVEDQN